MAYGNQFLKVSWIFGVIGTDEVAVTSLNFSTAPGWTDAVDALAEIDDATMTTILGRMATLYGVTGGRWADYSTLSSLKIAAIGTNGLYLADPRMVEDLTPAIGTTIGNPIQCTTVLSLGSGFSIGGGNRGRMYLPHFYMSQLTASPFTDATQAQGLADAGSTFLQDVTDDLNGDVTVALVPVIMSQLATPTVKLVQEVRVGNVTDTQRRRREQLPETYASASVP
jgi:hypothetical protein